MGVAQHLHFHVVDLGEISLQQDMVVAEGGERLAAGCPQAVEKFAG